MVRAFWSRQGCHETCVTDYGVKTMRVDVKWRMGSCVIILGWNCRTSEKQAILKYLPNILIINLEPASNRQCFRKRLDLKLVKDNYVIMSCAQKKKLIKLAYFFKNCLWIQKHWQIWDIADSKFRADIITQSGKLILWQQDENVYAISHLISFQFCGNWALSCQFDPPPYDF